MAEGSPVDIAGLAIRRASDSDESAIVELARDALGWVGDERDERFFAWKHYDNPFGVSPMWVVEDGSRIVGFRTFLRWEFVDRRGHRNAAVRAVDTATHPEYQGRGIFTALTLRALDDLRADGVEFVFNTPNEQSRPGYLKMGWVEVGRVPVVVRPSSRLAALRILRARTAAEKWSQPADFGEPASAAFDGDPAELDDLLSRAAPGPGFSTPRTAPFLRWRYGLGSLEYRVLKAGDTVRDGCAVFRVRRRGAARELVVCDVLVPADRAGSGARLVREALRASRADYAIAVSGTVPWRNALPLPGAGPVLTFRRVGDRVVEPPDFSLCLGDVELF